MDGLTVRLAWSKTRRNSAEFMPSSRPGVAADSVVSAYDEVIQISLVLCVECKNVDHNEGVNAPGLPSRSVYEPNVSVFKDNSPTVKWRFGKRATLFPSSAPLLPAPGLPQTPSIAISIPTGPHGSMQHPRPGWQVIKALKAQNVPQCIRSPWIRSGVIRFSFGIRFIHWQEFPHHKRDAGILNINWKYRRGAVGIA